MATYIEILSSVQQQQFNSPPKFTSEERQVYFELPDSVRNYIKTLRKPVNKASFILQFGYFRSKGRFFEPSQFQVRDVNYVHRIFGLTKPDDLDPSNYVSYYGGASSTRHRKEILRIERWHAFDEERHADLVKHAYQQTEKQAVPEEMLYALVSHCWSKKTVIPSYQVLSEIISQCYLDFENTAVSKIESGLGEAQREELDQLLTGKSENISLLVLAKRIEQSLKKPGMKKNAESLARVSKYYASNENLIDTLNLTDQATEYFSNWILKAKTSQINQIRNKSKAYLYLLSFIKSQFYKRQDTGLTSVLTNITASVNKANKKARDYEKQVFKEKNKAIDAVSNSHKKLTTLVGEIIRVIDDPLLTDIRKFEIIRNQLINAISDQDDKFLEKVNFLDKCREKEKKDAVRVDALEEESLALQQSISTTLKLLQFDEEYSDPALMQAIKFYQEKDGNIGQNPPLQFLSKKQKLVVYNDDHSLRTSLYKMFLFESLLEYVKGGRLSLKYSYEYRALQKYLIDVDEWQKNKADIMESVGLTKYADVGRYLKKLKSKLEATYETVNERFSLGHNGYLKMRPNGRFHVTTPAIDYEKSKYISSLLSGEGEIPVLQVLKEVDRITGFTKSLIHHSVKNASKQVGEQVAIAAIMALGCNIGPRRMARKSVGKSVGVTEATLLDCVNWRFKLRNLARVNEIITSAIEALDLPNIYKISDDCIHSSSDGKKITVAVDSILANYSFKYFGKEKGVSVYSFIDDKQSLFHPTVISTTDREAIYVVDGLLHNTTPIHHIHSTDTHGYTEAIFAATHFIGVEFAPRFKRIEDQVIYSFYAKKKYADKGYRVLPSRQINIKLIEENWDDMLRFMATIKLGRTTASQLFKRLNSYSKDHPLYAALKEFGRILKSQHILTFYDDLEFRQRIQKQLNRVELSNKFSDAVFWDREKQFQVGDTKMQQKYNYCKTIIQNAIIYWNYLFLSDRLLNTGNPQDKKDMLDSIQKGSVLAWKHISFTGEYDFTKPFTKDYQFNIKKIQRLKLGSSATLH